MRNFVDKFYYSCFLCFSATIKLLLRGEWADLDVNIKDDIKSCLTSLLLTAINDEYVRGLVQRLLSLMPDAWANPQMKRVLNGQHLTLDEGTKN